MKCPQTNTTLGPVTWSGQGRTNFHTKVNNKVAILETSGRRRTAFKALGVLVFILGLGSAGLIYGNAQHRSATASNGQGTSAVDGGWQDGTLSAQDSKKSSRDLELYYGKLGMLVVRLRDWVEQPVNLAIIIATVSTLAAVGCFLVADW